MDFNDQNYPIKYNLNDLKRRLKKGIKVKGRILDVPSKNRYVLRVWGYNIYTDSYKKFEKNEEIELTVKAIEPKLVFDMHRKKKNVNANKTNLLI